MPVSSRALQDDLVNEGGIMDLWVREARLFKYGLRYRLELLDPCAARTRSPFGGGGKSSGLMSFLKIGDRAAGAIKSGGTTRRAAKMVIVRHRPPGYRAIHRLEGEARSRRSPSLVTGSKIVSKHLQAVMTSSPAIRSCDGRSGDACFDPEK